MPNPLTMSDVDARCLEEFPSWLTSLGLDAKAILEVVEQKEQEERVRLVLAGALNYLFKSLDLIPDGIEDLGFIDDAFICRVAVALAYKNATPESEVLKQLQADAGLIQKFLGQDYDRLIRHTQSLETVRARGRTAAEVVSDEQQLQEFATEIRAWADSFEVPSFERDEKNLVKLRSFMSTRLPE